MGRENESVFGHLGHMAKMDNTFIYGKNPSKIFSRNKKPDVKYLGLWPIIVCSNDDPRLTLIYFSARSNLVS